MCPFPTSKPNEDEIKGDILQDDEQDADMESEDDPVEEPVEEEEETEVWTEVQQKKADAALLMYVIRSYHHISIVDDLKQLILTFRNCVVPDRNDITERILPHMYNACFNEQKANIQEAVTVCLSIEEWLSMEGESIVSISAHYLNSEFELKSVLLKCCEFYSYKAEEVATFFRETCTEWDIFSKVNGCSTNKDPGYKGALNLLGWNEFGCTAYALNLILQRSLKISKPILEKVKKVAQHFLYDSKSMDMLNDYQTDVQGLEEPIEIMDSNITYWSATYDMIEIFLTLQDAITTVLNEDGNGSPEFTTEDWTRLNQLFKLYKPISEATKELGHDKYVCGSTVIPIVNSLKNTLQEMNNNPSFCYVKNEIKCIMGKLNKQFAGLEFEPHLAMCTLLDPRYKMSKFVDLNAAEAAKANLVLEVQNLLNVTNITEPVKPESGDEHEQGNGNVILEKNVINNSENSLEIAQKETDLYIQDDLINGDASLWWKNNEQKYPHIAQLFKTKCNIVATSILSGHLFSEGGNNLCDMRKRLSADKVTYLAFLKANLKDEDDYLRVMP